MPATKFFFLFIILLARIDHAQSDLKQPHTWNVCPTVYQIIHGQEWGENKPFSLEMKCPHLFIWSCLICLCHSLYSHQSTSWYHFKSYYSKSYHSSCTLLYKCKKSCFGPINNWPSKPPSPWLGISEEKDQSRKYTLFTGHEEKKSFHF